MFIGRDEIVDQIRRHDPADRFVADIRGDLGTGRTRLLQHLDEKHPPDVRSIFVDLDDFNPDHPGQVGDKASVGAVQANFTEYARLLQFLVDQAAPSGATGRMRQAIQKARNDEIFAGRTVSIKASLDELNAPLDPQALADAWRRAADAITEIFLELWEGDARGCLLLLDNFDSVSEQEIGVWLTGLLHRRDQHGQSVEPLARPILVVTRSQGSAPSVLPGERVRSWSLSNLSLEEVDKFVTGYRRELAAHRPLGDGRRQVGGAEVDRATLTRINGVTDGHPAILRLVCDLLWGEALAAPGGSVEELLHDLPLPREERSAGLVERLVARLDVPGLMDAIEAAAVPRRFDAELLSALLVQEPPGGDDGSPSGAVDEDGQVDKGLRDHFERIRTLPFTEAGLRDGELRIHEYVRASIVARMGTLQKPRLQKLHERAETYYEHRLRRDFEDEQGRARSYGDWYFLESPVWQNRKREWLYHMSRLEDPKKRHGALLEATRLFLDAHWWWGNYVHFDFCDRLVADLGHLVRNLASDGSGSSARVQAGVELRVWPELSTLHSGLEDVLASYPLRSQKPPRAEWPLVRAALLKIQRACGLARLPERPSARQRHIYALLNVFLAHTWRYQAKARPDAETYFRRADKRYQDANGRFRENGDTWDLAWVAFERADLHLERARKDELLDLNALEQALRLSKDAADFVQPTPGSAPASAPSEDTDTEEEVESPAAEPDHELMSNLHRVRGDIHWLQGRPEQAAVCFGRAVLHSYLFHLTGGPPDEYTLQFYVDIRARALELLDSIWTQGREDDAVACAARMWREAWRTDVDVFPPDEVTIRELMPGIRADTTVRLALLLFPRGPDIEEIGEDDSAFTEEYDRFSDGLDHAVFRDLHEAI